MESTILYDSVFLVYNALETLNARNQDDTEGETIDPVPLSCEGEEKYSAGPNITNVIREVKFSWNYFSYNILKPKVQISRVASILVAARIWVIQLQTLFPQFYLAREKWCKYLLKFLCK